MEFYASKIYTNMRQNITTDSRNKDRKNTFKKQPRMVEAHKDPDKIYSVTNTFSTMKVIDDLLAYLSGSLYVKKVPLSYSIIYIETSTGKILPQAGVSVILSGIFYIEE